MQNPATENRIFGLRKIVGPIDELELKCYNVFALYAALLKTTSVVDGSFENSYNNAIVTPCHKIMISITACMWCTC